jgi:Sulfatase
VWGILISLGFFLGEEFFTPLPRYLNLYLAIAWRDQRAKWIALIIWQEFRILILYLALGLCVESLIRRRFPSVALKGWGAAVLFLLATGRPVWERNVFPSRPGNTESPSFFVLSFDAVHGDLFEASPHWKNELKVQALSFKNAYAVTNSTYTSWISILSGQFPIHSGVKSFFPSHRLGNLDASHLLPRVLAEHGYHTAFMTDCANTASMEKRFGFQDLYQPDRGLYECQEGVLASRHRGTRLFSIGKRNNWVFPSLDSDCSFLSRPGVLFSEVQKKLGELGRGSKPFLLVVHSCVTSPDTLLKNAAVSSTKEQYRDQLQDADEILATLWNQVKGMNRRPWTFFMSDHGIRFEKNLSGKEILTHATGLPTTRSLYEVPLAIFPPLAERGTESDRLVGLIDLYPTLLNLAKIRWTWEVDGVDLLKPDKSRDGLWLNSSLPLGRTSRKLQTLSRLAILNKDGTVGFPEQVETRLFSEAPLAWLSLPYRTLTFPDGSIQRFDEFSGEAEGIVHRSESEPDPLVKDGRRVRKSRASGESALPKDRCREAGRDKGKGRERPGDPYGRSF